MIFKDLASMVHDQGEIIGKCSVFECSNYISTFYYFAPPTYSREIFSYEDFSLQQKIVEIISITSGLTLANRVPMVVISEMSKFHCICAKFYR